MRQTNVIWRFLAGRCLAARLPESWQNRWRRCRRLGVAPLPCTRTKRGRATFGGGDRDKAIRLPDDALPRMESYVAYEVEDNTPRPRRENLRVTVTFHVGGDADSRVVGGSSSSATAGRAKSIKPATVSAAVYQGLQYSERPRSRWWR